MPDEIIEIGDNYPCIVCGGEYDSNDDVCHECGFQENPEPTEKKMEDELESLRRSAALDVITVIVMNESRDDTDVVIDAINAKLDFQIDTVGAAAVNAITLSRPVAVGAIGVAVYAAIINKTSSTIVDEILSAVAVHPAVTDPIGIAVATVLINGIINAVADVTGLSVNEFDYATAAAQAVTFNMESEVAP